MTKAVKNTCAFTGHRPERFSFGYDESAEQCNELKALLADWIGIFVASGIKTFYYGAAQGVDMWAAEIVIGLKKSHNDLQLIAVLPCETQALQWPPDLRDRYYNILTDCDDVVKLNKEYTATCMNERNRYLVDHTDYILAVYDGHSDGGTAFTVGYAKENDRTILIIHPETLTETSHGDMSALSQR